MKNRTVSRALLAVFLLGTMMMIGGCACKSRQKCDPCDVEASKSAAKPYTGETEGTK